MLAYLSSIISTLLAMFPKDLSSRSKAAVDKGPRVKGERLIVKAVPTVEQTNNRGFMLQLENSCISVLVKHVAALYVAKRVDIVFP